MRVGSAVADADGVADALEVADGVPLGVAVAERVGVSDGCVNLSGGMCQSTCVGVAVGYGVHQPPWSGVGVAVGVGVGVSVGGGVRSEIPP